jgi:DNA-binding GntR family transcriptional regulator
MSDLHQELQSFEESFHYLFGRPPGRRESAVEAVPAAGGVAELLGLPAGRPVLLRQLVMHDDEGSVREVSFTHFRGDRIALSSSGS